MMMPRLLAIGDIHGCFDALQTLLAFVAPLAEDTLVLLGDYVDRGPRSKDVLEWVMKGEKAYRVVPLRGNHEVMMVNARMGPKDMHRWCRYGGSETLNSYATDEDGIGGLEDVPDGHWDYITNHLHPYYESDSHLFVHATLSSDLSLEQQSDMTLYWNRYSPNYPGHMSGKKVICGHTSQESGLPAINEHSICIDTGACKGGWLTCLDVDSGQFWQANENGKTRQLDPDGSEIG